MVTWAVVIWKAPKEHRAVANTLGVALYAGVPLWAAFDVVMDARDRRRGRTRIRYSLTKYILVILFLMFIGGFFVYW